MCVAVSASQRMGLMVSMRMRTSAQAVKVVSAVAVGLVSAGMNRQ